MRRFILFICFMLALALFTINLKYITPVLSETETVNVYNRQTLVKSVVFAIGVNRYFVDGKAGGVEMDARPFIQNDRTFVPVRYLANALGVPDGNIAWDGSARKVTLDAGGRVEMVVGESWIAGNGIKKEIDAAPVIVESEGRVYLPARYVAEALGYDVGWEEAAQTVVCWPKGTEMPDVAAVKQYVVGVRSHVADNPPEEPFSVLPKVEVDESTAKGKIIKSGDGGSGYDTTPAEDTDWDKIDVK